KLKQADLSPVLTTFRIHADLSRGVSIGISGYYDASLEKYKLGYFSQAKLFNLLEVWTNHKTENDQTTPNSRKQSVWKTVDNMLMKL
ncbi:hypothetical protein, partial [Dapis sp. BLCC M229]|uniref:hypothetical protein n=1 Tax=Dapis sp. BLCC M229 TaxID=3400188 RepID=UPI003CFA9A87